MHATRFFAALAATAIGSIAAQTRRATLTVAPGTIDIEPGVTQNAWLFNGQYPGPVLRLREGERLEVRVRNQLPYATTVHWHGQGVLQGMDGVPGISRPAIASGQEFVYRLDDLEVGTYWYHPHVGHDQIDVGLAGVLIVDPADPRNDPPFDAEHLIVLDDWAATLGGNPPFFGAVLNGKNSHGQTDITVQPNQRVRLRLVNVANLTNFVVALDGHTLTVTHSDGRRVRPVTVEALPIGIGERYDVIVETNNPGVWSLAAALITRRDATQVRGIFRYAGNSQAPPPPSYVPRSLQFGGLLTYAQLAAFGNVTPITANPDRRYPASLGVDSNFRHTINGESWPVVTPMLMSVGQQVQVDMVNVISGYHPMHVHGHTFRLMNTAGGVTHPPVKDTVLIEPRGRAGASASVQILADNPGRWLFHCHDSFHMSNGMMGLFQYDGDDDGDGLVDAVDLDPTLAFPVLTISDQESQFRLGGSGAVEVQWPRNETVWMFAASSRLATPLVLPPLGTLRIDPLSAVHVGAFTANASGIARWAYTIPADPVLANQALELQAVASTALAGRARISTDQRLILRR